MVTFVKAKDVGSSSKANEAFVSISSMCGIALPTSALGGIEGIGVTVSAHVSAHGHLGLHVQHTPPPEEVRA